MQKFLWTSADKRALLQLQPGINGAKMKNNINQNQANISIVRQVLELEYKSLAELRAIYNSLHATPCTLNAHKDQLRPKIAYRLQELALGSLSDGAKSKLESLTKGGVKTLINKKHSDLLPGTKLCREYNESMHQVEILKDGFEYNGQKWSSLSAIATKITGSKWNGPRFFGLRT